MTRISPQTNGTADRAVRRLQEATATAMVQCGLPDQWWDRAKECCCCLRNAYNKMADSKTTYEKGCCVTWTFDTVWSQSQLQAHLSGRVCINLAKRCFPESSWDSYYVRGEDGQATCLSWVAKISRTWHPQISTSNGSSTRKSHKKDIRRFHVQTDTQPLRSSSIPTRRNACQGNPEEDGKGIQLLGETSCI